MGDIFIVLVVSFTVPFVMILGPLALEIVVVIAINKLYAWKNRKR
jgi:hypothetical protein